MGLAVNCDGTFPKAFGKQATARLNCSHWAAVAGLGNGRIHCEEWTWSIDGAKKSSELEPRGTISDSQYGMGSTRTLRWRELNAKQFKLRRDREMRIQYTETIKMKKKGEVLFLFLYLSIILCIIQTKIYYNYNWHYLRHQYFLSRN